MNFYARAWPARIPTSLISREAQLQTLQRYDATAGSASAHVIACAIDFPWRSQSFPFLCQIFS